MSPITLEVRMRRKEGTPEPTNWPELVQPSFVFGGTGLARPPAGEAGPGYLDQDPFEASLYVDGATIPADVYHAFVRATAGSSLPTPCYLQALPNVTVLITPVEQVDVTP